MSDPKTLLFGCNTYCLYEQIRWALLKLNIDLEQTEQLNDANYKDKITLENGLSCTTQQLWNNSIPIENTPAHKFLTSIGITLTPPPCIRYAKDIVHDKIKSARDAILCLIEDAQGFSLQALFMSEDNSTVDYDLTQLYGNPTEGAIKIKLSEQKYRTIRICKDIFAALYLREMNVLSKEIWVAPSLDNINSIKILPDIKSIIVNVTGTDHQRSLLRNYYKNLLMKHKGKWIEKSECGSGMKMRQMMLEYKNKRKTKRKYYH